MEKSFKSNTQTFEGEVKKVGEVLFGNDTLSVYEIRVRIIADNPIFDKWDVCFNKPEYEPEFINLAQKLLAYIEKEQPFSLAFIFSEINRYCFEENAWRSDDNPVRGFVQAWSYEGGAWLTWTLMPVVAEKIEKDKEFQIAFEKWALAKFLQLVFGDHFLSSPTPHYGSERGGCGGFWSGLLDAGDLFAYIFSTKNGIEDNFSWFYEDFPFWDMVKFSEDELERLSKLLTKQKLTTQSQKYDGYKRISIDWWDREV